VFLLLGGRSLALQPSGRREKGRSILPKNWQNRLQAEFTKEVSNATDFELSLLVLRKTKNVLK
jgi:hypothetical protein